jgi:hypothetical protein
MADHPIRPKPLIKFFQGQHVRPASPHAAAHTGGTDLQPSHRRIVGNNGAIDRRERGDDLSIRKVFQDQGAANRNHPIVLFTIDRLAEILGCDIARIVAPRLADQRQNIAHVSRQCRN